MLNIMHPGRTFLGAGWIVFAAIALAGCVGNSKLSDAEKARLIVEKRKEAEESWARYKASDMQDVEYLEKHVRLCRETTEIAPATCPRCWAEYGQSLSYLGYHYWYIYNDVLDDIENRRGDPGELRAEAEDYRQEWERLFKESNQAYENHFREVSLVHPYSYERVMRHYELLGNYERAIYYLDRCLEAYPQKELTEQSRRNFDRLRALYTAEAKKQKERSVLEDEGYRSPRRRAAQKARQPAPPPARGASTRSRTRRLEDEE